MAPAYTPFTHNECQTRPFRSVSKHSICKKVETSCKCENFLKAQNVQHSTFGNDVPVENRNTHGAKVINRDTNGDTDIAVTNGKLWFYRR